jgi:ribosomal protein S18 acetylase RimI-like enzyme
MSDPNVTAAPALLRVRLADVADAEFLVRGNASMALETEGLSLDLDRLRDGVHNLFEDPARGFYFVAEQAGRRVGQMMITYEWSDWRNATFWWIQSVWVEPSARRQGVFRALYAAAEAEAARRGNVCGLRLYVEAHNTRAAETYTKLGMQRTVYEMFEVDYVIRREA